MNHRRIAVAFALLSLPSCSDDFVMDSEGDLQVDAVGGASSQYPGIDAAFPGTIEPDALDSYAAQEVPAYVRADNATDNPVDDAAATLGRVLFYDVALSRDDTVSCSSCHQQSAAFGDLSLLSQGVSGVTGRHAMRLVNARFAEEVRFFWDERAASLEEQSTMPIQDHAEMGFSGESGDPTFADLLTKLAEIPYYPELFTLAFGDEEISEERMQLALADFIRSMQSFDSRYDEGLAAVGNEAADFPNFTDDENAGKRLFMAPPSGGPPGGPGGDGAGCATCHRPPTFDIDPASRNNGVIGVATDASSVDLTNTRSPSLRDIVGPSGDLNGPLMHDGSIDSLEGLLEHYTSVEANENLDPRLGPPLELTEEEKSQVAAFLRTLTGSAIYTDARWSDPFG